MAVVTEKSFENNDIEEMIDNNGTLQLNRKHIKERLDHKNLPISTRKYCSDYRNQRFELIDEPKKQPNRMFLHEKLALTVIKDPRTVEARKFREGLGFNSHDVINTKEQTVHDVVNTKEQVLGALKYAFEGENMQTQFRVLSYRIGLYFNDRKLAIEIDEFGHGDRNIDYEIQRQRAIKKELGCEFIRIKPGKHDFNLFKIISKIHRHIKKTHLKSR